MLLLLRQYISVALGSCSQHFFSGESIVHFVLFGKHFSECINIPYLARSALAFYTW
jgi:hypothetical protein